MLIDEKKIDEMKTMLTYMEEKNPITSEIISLLESLKNKEDKKFDEFFSKFEDLGTLTKLSLLDSLQQAVRGIDYDENTLAFKERLNRAQKQGYVYVPMDPKDQTLDTRARGFTLSSVRGGMKTAKAGFGALRDRASTLSFSKPKSDSQPSVEVAPSTPVMPEKTIKKNLEFTNFVVLVVTDMDIDTDGPKTTKLSKLAASIGMLFLTPNDRLNIDTKKQHKIIEVIEQSDLLPQEKAEFLSRILKAPIDKQCFANKEVLEQKEKEFKCFRTVGRGLDSFARQNGQLISEDEIFQTMLNEWRNNPLNIEKAKNIFSYKKLSNALKLEIAQAVVNNIGFKNIMKDYLEEVIQGFVAIKTEELAEIKRQNKTVTKEWIEYFLEPYNAMAYKRMPDNEVIENPSNTMTQFETYLANLMVLLNVGYLNMPAAHQKNQWGRTIDRVQPKKTYQDNRCIYTLEGKDISAINEKGHNRVVNDHHDHGISLLKKTMGIITDCLGILSDSPLRMTESYSACAMFLYKSLEILNEIVDESLKNDVATLIEHATKLLSKNIKMSSNDPIKTAWKNFSNQLTQLQNQKAELACDTMLAQIQQNHVVDMNAASEHDDLSTSTSSLDLPEMNVDVEGDVSYSVEQSMPALSSTENSAQPVPRARVSKALPALPIEENSAPPPVAPSIVSAPAIVPRKITGGVNVMGAAPDELAAKLARRLEQTDAAPQPPVVPPRIRPINTAAADVVAPIAAARPTRPPVAMKPKAVFPDS